MNRMGIRKKDLKDKKIVSGATINEMKNKDVFTIFRGKLLVFLCLKQ